ncbi:MAG TPA: glycosyltransferase [Candidatus Paceibacterota bacterium]|nr:glycosyltransferase [Candidatus Paceibacterota bacterium]
MDPISPVLPSVLYVITKGSWGGATKYVYLLARGAKATGYQVAVAYGEPGVLTERLAEHGIEAVQIPELGRDIHLRNDWSTYRALVRLFKERAPDIVHINSAKAGGLGALAARHARVPRIVFTAHGWAFNEDRPRWQRVIIWLLSGITVVLSDVTLCVSEAIKRDLHGFPGIAHKMVVVKNSLTCATLLPRSEARAAMLPGHDDKYWIGMACELHPTKRVVDAIRAFKTVHERHPNTILVVAGAGQEEARLRAFIEKLQLTDSIFLLGFVTGIDTKMSAFDLFLHTSRSEALALAILEAGCASLPVVATSVGGIPEVIEDGVSGILVPPFAPDIAAEKINELIDDPARARALGAALHTRVTTEFTEERMLRKTFGCY